jgi:hypothetical protein
LKFQVAGPEISCFVVAENEDKKISVAGTLTFEGDKGRARPGVQSFDATRDALITIGGNGDQASCPIQYGIRYSALLRIRLFVQGSCDFDESGVALALVCRTTV